MKRIEVLRLGLFQMTAGGLSVLFLGILNRVMRIELGLDLFAVTLLVGGGHYLGALIAIPFGYTSDRLPLLGYRRSGYILLGALGTSLILAGSIPMARWLAADPTVGRLTLGFFYFLLEGMATYVAGTAFLALITDLTRREERGQVTALVWTMLMVGIIATGIASAFVLDHFSMARVETMFTAAAVGGIALAVIAVVRQEQRMPGRPAATPGGLRAALHTVVSNEQARWFGGFLFLSMFAYFMQDVLLEPFGGEVFGLSPAQTTRFNAYMGVGVITSMLLGGSALIPRQGKRWTTTIGVVIMAAAFLGLAGSALAGLGRLLPVIILAVGTGAGLFTVGGVSMMMDMTATAHTGLFVGAWTLVQAIAKGPTAIAGGALHAAFVRAGATSAIAYGGVFIFEAAGLLISLLLLRKVAVDRFKASVEPGDVMLLEAMGS